MGLSEEYKRANGLTPEAIADTMLGFYARVEAQMASVEAALAKSGLHLRCQKGCSGCCRDGLTMSAAEAAVIHKLYPDIGHAQPHEPGACPFLDAHGACRIYEARPYICRTHGLPMRWFEEAGDIEVDETAEIACEFDDEDEVEVRDICELNAETVDVLKLSPEQCWNVGVAETQLALMNMCVYGEQAERVSMRSFFEN